MKKTFFTVLGVTEDGNTQSIYTDIASATKAYGDAEIEDLVSIHLLETEEGKEYGFGSQGEIFGAEVILEIFND